MNNPGNDQNPTEPPAADDTTPPPAEDLELIAPRECPDCRPEALDPLRCRAKGVKQQAAYDEQYKDGPNPDQYETARLQYGKARHDATPAVAKIREQLAQATDKLRCLIDDSEIIECLDEAWHDVERRLEVCNPQLGCCVDEEGDFDTDVSGCGIETLKARIAEYEHRTEAAEKCFATLLKEPGELTKRVLDLEAEVTGIDKDICDEESADRTMVYARALVARWHLEEVWWGYDHPHDYVDCVCLALRISLRGRAALSRLTGELAVRTCLIETRAGRCKALREKIAEAIIEEYVRRCRPQHRHDHDHEHDRDHEHEHEHDGEHRHRRDDDWDNDEDDDRDDHGDRERGRRERDYSRRREGDRDRRRREGDRDYGRRDRDRGGYRDRT
jgi:hypothetical protein